MYEHFDRFVRVLVNAAFIVSAVAALLIMMIGSIDVLGTYLFNTPLAAAVEAQEVLMGIAIFLAFAGTQRRREHIDVDIVKKLLPQPVQHVLTLLAIMLAMLIFGLIAWRSMQLALNSWQIRETAAAAFPFPLYPGKFLVSFGAGVAAIESLRQGIGWFLKVDERSARAADREGI